MEIGRVGGSSEGFNEFWGPRVFYFNPASPLILLHWLEELEVQ